MSETYEPGDRVLVRLGSGREHEAEVIVDRVERVRVIIDGDRATVLKSRVRHAPGREAALRHSMSLADAESVRSAQQAALARAGVHVEVGQALPRATQSFRDGVAALVESGGPTEFVRSEAHALRAVPKPPKPWRSDAYRHFVREHDACCCCGEPEYAVSDPIVAHHHGPHAMGQKTDDTRCVPLLDSCHRYFHTHGTFRGMTREETDHLAAREQARLLTDYCRLSGIDADAVIVTALTDALRGR